MTVSDGIASISSSKDVSVVGSYWFPFSQTSSLWGKTTITTTTLENGILSISSSDATTSATFGYILTTTANPPYSIKTKIAVNAVDFAGTATPRVCFYFWFTNPGTGGDYLSCVYLGISPSGRYCRLRAGMHTESSNSVIYQDITSDSYLSNQIIFTQNNEYHTVGMAVLQDKTLIINIDGSELYRTTALATNSIYNRDLTLARINYTVDPGIILLLDDFYLTTDDTVLK